MVAGLRSSSIYRSKPRYVLDQPDFFNLAASGDTELGPDDLLDATKAIEARHGRNRELERRKGPRTLDIDILLYGGLTLDTPDLVVPHPGMLERAFVLVPLAELEPALRHPATGALFTSSLGAVAGQGIYLHAKAPL
jgi:2-amino-4-hydroxy-6-hydroxymethyldihydropteridine diphosphokinase